VLPVVLFLSFADVDADAPEPQLSDASMGADSHAPTRPVTGLLPGAASITDRGEMRGH